MIGQKYEFGDDEVRRTDSKYRYADITKLIVKKEYIMIKFGKAVLPVIITEQNREQVLQVVETIRRVKSGAR